MMPWSNGEPSNRCCRIDLRAEARIPGETPTMRKPGFTLTRPIVVRYRGSQRRVAPVEEIRRDDQVKSLQPTYPSDNAAVLSSKGTG